MPADAFAEPLGQTATAWRQRGGWFVSNAGWVIGDGMTLLVDTCATEQRTRELLGAAGATTSNGSLAVVVTHAHGDHANGAGHVARQGGRVLAHPNAIPEIQAGPHTFPAVFETPAWGDITPPALIEAVSERIRMGHAEVIPVPAPAHTTGDLVVWVPDEGVLFTGDLLFHGSVPLAVAGSVSGWLAALEWLETIGASRIVPGHGPVATPGHALIHQTRDYLRWLLDVVGADDPDYETLQRDAADRWPSWSEAERHAINLRAAHAERHGYELNLPAGLQAMTAAANCDRIALDL